MADAETLRRIIATEVIANMADSWCLLSAREDATHTVVELVNRWQDKPMTARIAVKVDEG